MRDVLRELPEALRRIVREDASRISAKAFYEIALSEYASRADRKISPYRRRLALDYQRHYLDLIDSIAAASRRSREEVLEALSVRAVSRNPYARMTGDGLTHATKRVTANRKRLAPEETFRLIQAFAASQQRDSVSTGQVAGFDPMAGERPLVKRIHRDLHALVQDFRESL